MIFLTLGLLAKPMIVTVPFVLLLLDYWPLRRSPRLAGDHSPSSWKTLTIEKIPLLALAVAASLATFVAQRSGGAMVPLGSLPITQRLANSALSYWRYLGKIFWPHNLCVFYPRIMDLPVIWVALSIVLIAVITIISIFAARRAPFLIVGWLFFLGMLVPVIGLVQVGWQSMADRYLYLPIIGPIVMVLWSAESIARHMRSRLWIQPLLNALPAAVIALLAAVTIHQLTFWHDTQTLFNRALAVEPQNTLAHVQLGYFAAHDGRFGDAERHYQQAIHIDPTYFVPEFDLANLLLRLNQPEAALKYYEQAAANQPTVAIIQNNWGIALEQLHRPREAFDHFAAAVKSDPNFAQAHLNLAQLFLSAGQLDSAESEFQATLRLSPDNPAAINGLAAVGAAR
jgi:Tfp pilus assembly protein PilF